MIVFHQFQNLNFVFPCFIGFGHQFVDASIVFQFMVGAVDDQITHFLFVKILAKATFFPIIRIGQINVVVADLKKQGEMVQTVSQLGIFFDQNGIGGFLYQHIQNGKKESPRFVFE